MIQYIERATLHHTQLMLASSLSFSLILQYTTCKSSTIHAKGTHKPPCVVKHWTRSSLDAVMSVAPPDSATVYTSVGC